MKAGILINHQHRLLVLLFTIFPFTGILFGQTPVIENIIEEIISQSEDEEADLTTFVEDLSHFYENKINLNEISIEQLEKLHFLNEFQINNLINYISLRGEMYTIYELQLIEGFTPEVIKNLLPFVKVEKVKKKEKVKFYDVYKYGKHKLIAENAFQIQEQKAYKTDTITGKAKYAGDKMKYKLKYKFSYRDKIHTGFTMEKDAGEDLNFQNNKYGFDFYSAHLQINNIGRLKRLTLGDFQAKFGQGLVIWTGFGLSKSSDVLSIRKKGQGIRYYSSTNENSFLRGSGATLEFGKFNITAFGSYKKIDASLLEPDSSVNSEIKLVTIQKSGYHRTETEISNRKTIDEKILGTRFSADLNDLIISANFVIYGFQYDFASNTKPYKLYDLSEKSNYNLSIDYKFFIRNLCFFGESAMDKNQSIAVQNGMIAKLVPQLSFSLLHRFYEKSYQAHYSSSFSANTKINNETGLYYGVEYHPIRKLKISAYADFYEFPWLKSNVDAPSTGRDYLVQASYSVSRNVDMYFRWKKSSKAKNLTSEELIQKQIINPVKDLFRYNIAYSVNDQVQLNSRVEISYYLTDEMEQIGYMFYQDANFSFKNLPISCFIRYAVFDATNNSKSYAYEKDLLYNYSTASYSGRGSRMYLMLRYKIAEFMDIRLRYSHYYYPGVKIIGSGLSEINGNLKSEFKIQVVAKF